MGTSNFGIDEDFIVEFGIGNIDALEAMKRRQEEQVVVPIPDPSDIPVDYPILPYLPDSDAFDAGIDSFASNMVKDRAAPIYLPPIPTFDFEPTAKKNNIRF